MQQKLRLVLFDCDGTLVDSALVIQNAMNNVFDKFSYKTPSFDEIRNIIGLSLDVAISRLLQRPVDDEINAMVSSFKQNFSNGINDIPLQEPLFPGIRDLLSKLEVREDILLGVVTGKSRRGIDKICEAYKLKRFVTLKTADDCPSKPNPAMVLESCSETGVLPADTYVVGDTLYDMQMAKQAGTRAIGVSWGYHTTDALKQAGAEVVLNEPVELLNLLGIEDHA